MINFILKYFGCKIIKQDELNYQYRLCRQFKEYGHDISIRENLVVNSSMQPIPWFTYPAIEYLEQFDFSNFDVLEWGSGSSSIYFSSKVKSILSIEDDEKWFNQILSDSRFFGTIKLAKNKLDYISIATSTEEKYDLIIIDGKYRDACIDNLKYVVKPSSIVIFDNSDRNPELCEVIRNMGFLEVDMHGISPKVVFATTTSFFFGKECVLKPKDVQPTLPLGGGY